MKRAALTAALFVACTPDPRRHVDSGHPDAGAPPALRPLLLKLGRPAIETEGEAWVPKRDSWHSYLHTFAGTATLTVRFPSGREWTSVATMIAANLNDDTRVRHIEAQLARFATWEEAFAAADKELVALGVDARYRTAWAERMRTRRVEYPSYPVEGCFGVTTAIKEFGRERWYFTLHFDEFSPRDWSELHEGWPDTCPSAAHHLDAGPGQP